MKQLNLFKAALTFFITAFLCQAALATTISGTSIEVNGGTGTNEKGNILISNTNAGDSTHTTLAQGGGSIAIGSGAGAIGTDPSSMAGTIAIGYDSSAQANGALALGMRSTAFGDDSIALGDSAFTQANETVAIGTYANADQRGSVAIGAHSYANEENTVSVGDSTTSLRRRIVNVADGIADTDAATVGQLKAVEIKVDTNTLNIQKNADNITALDTMFTAKTDALEIKIESNAQAIASNAANIAKNTQSIQQNADNITALDTKFTAKTDALEVKIENNTQAIASNAANIAKNSDKIAQNTINITKNTQNIQQNAAEIGKIGAVLGTDYRNPTFTTLRVGNMSCADNSLNMGGGRITGLAPGRISADSTDAVTGAQLWGVYRGIDDTRKSANVIGAHAAALSGLHPIQYDPYRPTSLAAAFGTYRDEYSLAMGVFHYTRENVMFNVGASLNSEGDVMGRAGVTFALGKKPAHIPAPQDVSDIQQQLIAMQTTIDELKAHIERLEASSRF